MTPTKNMIHSCSTLKPPKGVRYHGRVFDFAPYQKEWFQHVIDHNQTVIIAFRKARKTFTLSAIAAFFMMRFPGYLVNYLPSGCADQNTEFLRYIRAMIPASMRGEIFSRTEMNLKSGSRVLSLRPTIGGVESKRCNMLIVDEAQLLDDELWDQAYPQLTEYDNGNGMVIPVKKIFAGTSRYPSFLNDIFDRDGGIMVDVYQGYDEGTITKGEMDEAKVSLSREGWQEFYECKWVKKDGYVFEPPILPSPLERPFPFKNNIGIDCNLYPGLVWVKVESVNGKLVATEEGVIKYAKNASLLKGDKITIESNGANMGFVPHVREHATVPVIPNNWGAGNKSIQIERMKLLQDDDRLAILDTCENLIEALDNLKFTVNGTIDKKRSGEKIHYFDAWVHGVIGLSKESTLDIQLRYYGVT